mgnify:CR=1 FL=1
MKTEPKTFTYIHPTALLSEGVIFEKNDNLLRKFSKNDLTDIYIKIDEDDENYSPRSKLLSPLTPKNSNFNVFICYYLHARY